ncbi:MAG: hypothetical protein AB1861_05100 [Cyanobacteriota bacterium]
MRNFQTGWRDTSASVASPSCDHPLRVSAIFAFVMPCWDASSDCLAISQTVKLDCYLF